MNDNTDLTVFLSAHDNSVKEEKKNTVSFSDLAILNVLMFTFLKAQLLDLPHSGCSGFISFDCLTHI